MQTLDYAPGRTMDLYGTPSRPPVLLWHGRQTDARASVAILAEELTARGLGVAVPDWNSHAPDGGRRDLLASVAFARKHTEHPDALVLVGWSMGGLAAAGLTLSAAHLDVALAHTVCLAGAFSIADPISGEVPSQRLSSVGTGNGFTLLHGTDDDVVPVEESRSFAGHLDGAGWTVDLVELAADHGSIAGARYDADGDRYVATDDDETRAVVAQVAGHIVDGARR